MTQKEKAYDEALKKIRQFIDGYSRREISKEELEDIFPELKESEDERIRKSLIEHLQYDVDDMVKSDFPFDYEAEIEELSKYIAWLKKLDVQKWTEEDEKRLQSCISTLQVKSLIGDVDTINTKWLKSLKQRIG